MLKAVYCLLRIGLHNSVALTAQDADGLNTKP